MNQEKIYKLIDREGYLCNSFNEDILLQYRIVKRSCTYFKGYLDRDGDLMSCDDNYVLISKEDEEFKYCEEVD